MPRGTPLPEWEGEDAYVIGGGRSLETFDFHKLHGLNTIGCNQAFIKGVDIVNVCIFGDSKFWDNFDRELASFGGWVVTNQGVMQPPPWLLTFDRVETGLSVSALGWNYNTGASAINLAFIMGARRVYLLGFDMHPTGHWHGRAIEQAREQHYERFQEGFDDVERSLPVVFPGRQVFNVTDGSSKLRAFPRSTFTEAGL